MFNEKFVVDRLLESVAALDYPQDKLEIQILDDSTDDTTEQCYRKVEELKSRGFDAVCIHRTDRTGFKAGALEAATKVAKGEFLLILDADFVPEPDLLQKTIHFFTDEAPYAGSAVESEEAAGTVASRLFHGKMAVQVHPLDAGEEIVFTVDVAPAGLNEAHVSSPSSTGGPRVPFRSARKSCWTSGAPMPPLKPR